jgi:hypothetical protein
LKNYWKTWSDYANEKNSININQTQYDEIQKLLAPSAWSAPSTSIPAAQPDPISRQVNHAIATPADEVSQWQVSAFLGRHALRQSAVQYTYGDTRSALAHATQNKGKKRAMPEDVEDAPIVSKRKPRTCTRCKRADCDGRFRGRDCSIPVCVFLAHLFGYSLTLRRPSLPMATAPPITALHTTCLRLSTRDIHAHVRSGNGSFVLGVARQGVNVAW